MATIEKRRGKDGKVRYRVKVRRKGAESISETFARLTDARAFARRTEADIEAGKHIVGQESKRHTLDEAIARYLETVLSNNSKRHIRFVLTPQFLL